MITKSPPISSALFTFRFFKLNPFLGCYNHCFGAQLFLAVRLTELLNREIIAKEDTYYVPNLQQIPNSKLPSPANHDLHGRSNNNAQQNRNLHLAICVSNANLFQLRNTFT